MSKQKLIGRSGVYAILINDVIRYIGSASNLESRKSNHLSNLRHNKHSNKELQELFNEFGEEKFKFYALDYCNKSSLYEMERQYMRIHADTIVNQQAINDTKKKVRRGKESSNFKHKFSELMSGENNPNASITEQIAAEIIWLKQNTDMTHRAIAEKYGISKNIVSRTGRDRWMHVQPVEPIESGEI